MKTLNGIFMACDSQVSAGNLKLPDAYNKIEVLGGNVLISSCGSVGLCQQLSHRSYQNCKVNFISMGNYENEPDVSDIARELSNLNFYLPLEFKTFSSAGFLLGGISNNEFKAYSVSDDGSKIEVQSFASDGSGSQIALGLLESFYRVDLGVDETVNILASTILSSSKADLYTNSKIKVYAITKDCKIREWNFSPDEIETKPKNPLNDKQ